jgi:hypothetical protein
MPYVAFVAVADYRRGIHLPLSAPVNQSNIQHPIFPRSHKPLICNVFNQYEPNGMTFALNFLKARRVKAVGQGLIR